MNWPQKTLIGIGAAALGVLVSSITVSASPAQTALFSYVKTANGYAYDQSRPVYYSSDSTEPIEIPVANTPTKRQFRGSWVPTVNQISIKPSATEQDFQSQFDSILGGFDSAYLNALIFQVRPAQDAFYPSALNPWSQFLTGAQGKDPGYDPLKWMIERTHQRGLEYHAWFNPYRVTASSLTSVAMLTALGLNADQANALTAPQAIRALNEAGVLADTNYAVQHPENVLLFNGLLFLNPGIPDAMKHVIDSINEIATTYDIDAVHLDDYFYPYNATISGKTVSFASTRADHDTFLQYGLSQDYPDTEAGIADWRRANVTALISGIHTDLDTVNRTRGTAIQFGVSPFGIWQHASVDPRGSHTPTSSTSSYSVEYADTYSWVKNELVDYIAPQIYWSFDQTAAPYGELARWWNSVVEGTNVHLYIGHANYKYVGNGPRDATWMNPDEIPHQMLFNQTLSAVSGSIFYGYNDITPSDTSTVTGDLLTATQAKNAAISRIFTDMFATTALPPATIRLADARLRAPTTVTLNDSTDTLSWTDGSPGASRAFVIYRGVGAPEDVVASPAAIMGIVPAHDSTAYSFALNSSLSRAASTSEPNLITVVTALDRAENESAPSRATTSGQANTDATEPSVPSASTSSTLPHALAATGSSLSSWLYAGALTAIMTGCIGIVRSAIRRKRSDSRS